MNCATDSRGRTAHREQHERPANSSMILAAWSEGIGSNWVGFLGFAEVKVLLGIPDNLDVLAILPFGYPKQKIGHGKKQRKPLSQVAHRERFGQVSTQP